MSHLHTPTSSRAGSRLDDPKYLFSAEAREAIKRHPSMTPVPLFHHHQQQQHHRAAANQPNSQLISPSGLSNSTSLSSSAQPLDHRSLASTASSSYMSTGLIRPQPRSPHDAEAWDNNASLTAHSPFQQTYGAYTHYQHPHTHMPALPSSLSSTALPPSPASVVRPTAPFFASLAKHSSLGLASPSPARPYLPAAVSVYGQFDSAVWQRTPLPKSLSAHPMAVAQSEARRQREEWERENKRLWELERERDELLRRGEERQRMQQQQQQQQEMHMRAMKAQDEAAEREQHTPVVVKRGSAAAIGSRPSVSLRRSAQSAEAGGFVTPAAKPRRRPEATSDIKKRVQAAVGEKDREERKEADTAEMDAAATEMQNEIGADIDGSVASEDEQAQYERPPEAEDEGLYENESEERSADSDTEDEEDEAGHETEAEKQDSVVQLSPPKKRSSNRIYTAPTRSSSSTSPRPADIPLPPPPPGLKPDMSLTRWYFHIQQHNPPHPPRIVLKGTHVTEGPWSSGYVLDREHTTGRVLLTNSRRYILYGEMDDVEMEWQGWSERMRRACADGLPVEWKDWLVREGERRVQEQQEREAKRVSFDFAGEEEIADEETVKPQEQQQQQQEEEQEEEREEEEPTSHSRLSPVIRARRSPAPIRHSEWWEDEVMRLVEAVSMHAESDVIDNMIVIGSDTVELWKRVAEEVSGGRRWEECRRKFDEVRREQSRGMKESEKKKDKVKRIEQRQEKVSEKKAARKSEKTRKEAEKGDSTADGVHKATKRSLIPPTATTAAAASAHARSKQQQSGSEEKREKQRRKQKQKQQQREAEAKNDETEHETSTDKKLTPKPKPSALLPASSTSPSTPAAAAVEHAVINPHDMAYTHTRRSGRAVMAPLKHWELEREVNGVILRGFQHGGDAIRRVLTEKERMEKDSHSHTLPPLQYSDTKRRVGGGERRVKAKRWSADEREQLRLAYMWVEPSEKGFWLTVSRFMAGRTADECQAEYEKLYPTPKRRGKKREKDELAEDEQQAQEEKSDEFGKDEAKEEADDERGGQTKKRKRMTTVKREIRNALDSRQQQHNGDDLFDSTPYKHNTQLTAPQPQPNTQRSKRGNNLSLQQSTDGEEAEGSLLFAGDVALADIHVQRVVKERRRVRANRGKVVEAERRRQGKEEDRSKRSERMAEGANELRLGVRRLEADDEERQQELMDEMDDDMHNDEEEDEIVED